MGKIKVVIIRPHKLELGGYANKHDVEVKEIENELETYYKEIGCEMIDIQERTIDGKAYDIICDEEYLLTHQMPQLTVDSKLGIDWSLFGTVIICRQRRGKEIGLTDIEVARIMENLDENNCLIVD